MYVCWWLPGTGNLYWSCAYNNRKNICFRYAIYRLNSYYSLWKCVNQIHILQIIFTSIKIKTPYRATNILLHIWTMGKTFRQKIKCIIKQTQCCSIVGLCRDMRCAVNMFIIIFRCCLRTYLELFLQSSKLLKIVNSKFFRKWVISFPKNV